MKCVRNNTNVQETQAPRLPASEVGMPKQKLHPRGGVPRDDVFIVDRIFRGNANGSREYWR